MLLPRFWAALKPVFTSEKSSHDQVAFLARSLFSFGYVLVTGVLEVIVTLGYYI